MLAGVQAAALLIAAKRSDAVASEIALHTEKNSEDLKGLLAANTALTRDVKRATDLLDHIAQEMDMLTGQNGTPAPE